jgi:hypothetical protein
MKLWMNSTGLDLTPTWALSLDEEKVAEEARSPQGGYFSTHHGHFRTFSVPCDFVPSSLASVLNSWWTSGALCQFEVFSEVYSVQFIGDASPFQEFQKPYWDRYKGILKMSTY